MPVLLTYYRTMLARIAARARAEMGIVSTETVILTALLAAVALGGGAIILNKVLSTANAIPTP